MPQPMEKARRLAMMKEVEERLAEMAREVRGYQKIFDAGLSAYSNKQEEFAIELRKSAIHLDEARRLCIHLTDCVEHLRLNDPAPVAIAAE